MEIKLNQQSNLKPDRNYQPLFSIVVSIVFAVLMLGNFYYGMAQPKNNKKINKLPRKYEVADTIATIDYGQLLKTIAHHEQMIAKYPDQTFIPYLMFELAELYASKSQFEFKQQMNQYDVDISKFDSGKSFKEPIMPRINMKQSIEIAYKLLEKYPNVPYKDKILYRLAISHLDEGNQDKAKQFFERLIFETPESQKTVSYTHLTLPTKRIV